MEEKDTSNRDALITQIAKRRHAVERKGVEHNGVRFHGDPGGRQSVTEAIRAAEDYEDVHGEGSWSTDWKGLDGWLTDCTLADLLIVGRKLAARRQACFRREKELVDQVDSISEEDIGTGWPD